MFSFKKIINITLFVFVVAFSVLVCFNKFNRSNLISNNNNQLQIYELWHIESFEGGGQSRQNYLTQIALNYESEKPTHLFMVKTVEADQLKNALQQNTPDLISFSEQVAKTILPYLTCFEDEYDVQPHYLDSARYNGKLMAVPFIASGYCYFTKTTSNQNLSLYTANNNLHSATPVVIGANINNGKTLSSYQCYTQFINNNNIKLLGTARDLFRSKNLESLGRFSINYEPVSTFTDLIQYIGVSTAKPEVLNFVNYLLSNANQRNLANIGLFSTKHLKLYTEPTYAQMEQALTTCKINNIFNN